MTDLRVTGDAGVSPRRSGRSWSTSALQAGPTWIRDSRRRYVAALQNSEPLNSPLRRRPRYRCSRARGFSPRIGHYLSPLVSTGRVAGRHPSHLPQRCGRSAIFRSRSKRKARHSRRADREYRLRDRMAWLKANVGGRSAQNVTLEPTRGASRQHLIFECHPDRLP
jgi:hypothetical protein